MNKEIKCFKCSKFLGRLSSFKHPNTRVDLCQDCYKELGFYITNIGSDKNEK